MPLRLVKDDGVIRDDDKLRRSHDNVTVATGGVLLASENFNANASRDEHMSSAVAEMDAQCCTSRIFAFE